MSLSGGVKAASERHCGAKALLAREHGYFEKGSDFLYNECCFRSSVEK